VPALKSAKSADRAYTARVDGRNSLLRALPDDEYARLFSSLEPVRLDVRQVLYEPEEPIDHVYFPETGVVSLLALDDSAGAVEVGTIGNEGMTGLAVFHGLESTPQQCFAQVAGDAVRLPAAVFSREVAQLPHFRARVHRYAHCFFNDVAQSVACNQLHSIQQRCARWLLMTHDRVSGNEFLLTQQFLSFMLGTRRASVSVAAKSLQRRGLITYSRGKVRVLDRDGLEAASCACYRITRAAYDDLLADKWA
jgi:CRP-like cAMP-binding protein